MDKRVEKAFEDAKEICEDFTYRRVVSEPSAGIEVWRCGGKDFDNAHDLVVSPMGIAAFGDMDPLVFREFRRPLSMLATDDLIRLASRLDESVRHMVVDESELHRSIQYRLAAVVKKTVSSIPSLSHAVEQWITAPSDRAPRAFTAMVNQLHYQISEGRWPSAIVDLCNDLMTLREEIEDAHGRVEGVARALFESGDTIRDAVKDSADDLPTIPSDSVLRRLAILSIGARRIQAQIEAEVQPETRPVADGDARYVHGNWTHLFGPGKGREKLTRLVFDRQEERLVALQIAEQSDWGKFREASAAELADVEDSLKSANPEALDDPSGYGLEESDGLPEWVACEFPVEVLRPRPRG